MLSLPQKGIRRAPTPNLILLEMQLPEKEASACWRKSGLARN